MRRFISYLLIAAMLVSCLSSAVIVFAAGATLTAESVEKMEGTGATVSPKITIADNPGVYYIKLVVYYDKTQLAMSDADAFADSVFGDDSSVGAERAGTNKDVKAYIPAELQSSSKGFVVELLGTYDEDLGDTSVVTENGLAVSLPLEIIAEDFGTFNYNVVVAEAYDADFNEIEIADVAGTVTYVADPYTGIYDEFTVFMTPEVKDVDLGTNEISVDIRFDANPGLWSTRLYIVYPEALTLGSAESVVNPNSIYTDPADLIVGIPDIALDDPRQVDAFQNLMRADPSIVRDGYHSTTIYFEPAQYDKVNSGNGILCTLNFTVADDIEAGDVLDIAMYYAEADFLYAGTKDDGTPEFIFYNPTVKGAEFTVVEKTCEHTNTTVHSKNATCSKNGYRNVVCTDCGETVSEEIIPASGHSYLQPGATITYPPTCTEDGYYVQYCDHCDYEGILPGEPAWGHDEDGAVVEVPATCITPGRTVIYCDYCGEVSRTIEHAATGHNFVGGVCGVCGVSTYFEAESVEKTEGTGANVSPEITIVNNPGVYYIKFVVYYDKTQLARSDADPFVGSVFGDDSFVGYERAGTHRDVKSYIPAELQSSSKGFIVELLGTYDEELGDTSVVTESGLAVSLPLEIISEDYGTFNYNIVVAEAYDADGNDIEISGAVGTVTYVSDPLSGIYDEFTVFMTPESEDVALGTNEISVDIRFDNNPGIWATRIYIVYPEALTLGSAENVINSLTIYTDPADLIVGVPDIALDDPRQVDTFQDLMKNDPSIVREGYHSTTIYFEPAQYDKVNSGNGVLCTLNFTISGDVEPGDLFDIVMYYGEGDFLYAGTNADGMPEFVFYYPEVYGTEITVACDHLEKVHVHKDATCVENGYDREVCKVCGKVFSETIIPVSENHTPGAAATCTEGQICTVCGIEIAPPLGHTPGAEATCTVPQVCAVCSVVIEMPLGHTEGEPMFVAPTCTYEGEEIYYCSVCSAYIRTEMVPALGHTVVMGTCTVCGDTELADAGLLYTVSDGQVTVVGYAGAESEIYIPYTIEGYPVTTLYNSISVGNQLTSVVLSDKIESLTLYIGAYAPIEKLYINRVDMNISYSDPDYYNSGFAQNVMYVGTSEEFSENINSWYDYLGNVICNVGTPMEGFIHTTNEDCGTITITGYSGLSTDLVIPAEFKGYRVTAIDPSAFRGRTDITSISIPGTVEFIEDRSFENCTALKNVTFGEGICEIGDYAFSGCTSLESVVLPESVVYVWAYAFNKCTSLQAVYLPSTLAAIEYKAFYRCENIYSVTYNGSPSEFGKVYMGNGNDPITMTEIEYLKEDEVKTVMIPVPEGMDPADCRLYYIDENGVATELLVEIVDGHFVVVTGAQEQTGYYMVRDTSGDISDSVILGDVDGDGKLSALDANALSRIISGMADAPEGSDKYIAADINVDGNVNAADLNIMKRLLAGVIAL